MVTLKSSVNYVGKSSMIIGIKVESENIQTGEIKHCNSSYFTMVAKDKENKNVIVPGLLLSNLEEVRRFYNSVKQIALKKERSLHQEIFDHTTEEALNGLKQYNVKIVII